LKGFVTLSRVRRKCKKKDEEVVLEEQNGGIGRVLEVVKLICEVDMLEKVYFRLTQRLGRAENLPTTVEVQIFYFNKSTRDFAFFFHLYSS
jgi:hypothetical protein